jgi:hypothetical protein
MAAFGIVLRELFEKYPLTLRTALNSIWPKDFSQAVRMNSADQRPNRRKITSRGKWRISPLR